MTDNQVDDLISKAITAADIGETDKAGTYLAIADFLQWLDNKRTKEATRELRRMISQPTYEPDPPTTPADYTIN